MVTKKVQWTIRDNNTLHVQVNAPDRPFNRPYGAAFSIPLSWGAESNENLNNWKEDTVVSLAGTGKTYTLGTLCVLEKKLESMTLALNLNMDAPFFEYVIPDAPFFKYVIPVEQQEFFGRLCNWMYPATIIPLEYQPLSNIIDTNQDKTFRKNMRWVLNGNTLHIQVKAKKGADTFNREYGMAFDEELPYGDISKIKLSVKGNTTSLADTSREYTKGTLIIRCLDKDNWHVSAFLNRNTNEAAFWVDLAIKSNDDGEPMWLADNGKEQ